MVEKKNTMVCQITDTNIWTGIHILTDIDRYWHRYKHMDRYVHIEIYRQRFTDTNTSTNIGMYPQIISI